MENIDDDDLYLYYFKQQKDYYKDVLEKVKANKKVIFGVFPFLFTLLWMLYRKMYFVSFISLIFLSIIAESLEKIWLLNVPNADLRTFSAIQNIGFAIIFGLFGNWLYIKDAERKITKLMKKHSNKDILIEEIGKIGGTNWIAPLIFLGIMALILWAASISVTHI